MNDIVNHPPHYVTDAGIEAIDVIEQYGLGLHLGNAMKYLLRAGRKGDAATDLKKALWYVERWIEGIGPHHGVEYPIANDDIFGGIGWRAPISIAAAFALDGDRRLAVIAILSASAIDVDAEDCEARIKAARRFVAEAISNAEAVLC